MGIPIFHRNEQYNASLFVNQNVENLKEQIGILKQMIKVAEDELYKIQTECNHDYYFSSSGMYEDNFVCIHCGHETER